MPTTSGSRVNATPAPSSGVTRSAAPMSSTHAPGCVCPVCAGLQTFVRPRFFAGQLLTDSELTALTQYVVDKQRLHNVYLHGWGVVCGLQVECDGCGPGVLVRPGYAIDPCGYDIVAPAAVSVDVISLIQQCQVTDRAMNCDPPTYPQATGCEDEQTWCLFVRYTEQDSRPVSPLGGTAMPSCGCGGSGAGSGCGCGGASVRAGWECGCSNGSSRSTNTCGCTPAPASTSSQPADCEPSRTYEMYEFGVCRPAGDCHDLGERLDGTFPAKVLACIKEIQPIVSRRMTGSMQKSAGHLLLGNAAGVRGDSARTVVCTLYSNVVELYRKDPLRTQCVLPAQLDDIDCSPQGTEETETHYQQRLVTGLQTLVILVLAYLRDCVCYNILPPCPDAPCDDRVVLACMTVKNGRVASICNLDCRRYAGSFVTREYWLPIGPVLSWLAGLACCFPLLNLRPRLGDRSFVSTFATDPRYEQLRRVIWSDDFAVLSLWKTRLKQFAARLRPGEIFDRVNTGLTHDAGNVPLARYVNMPAAGAVSSLQGLGVQVEQVEVSSDHAAPIRDLVPSVPAGGTATLYVYQGTVVGVAATRTAATASESTPTASESSPTASGSTPTASGSTPTASGSTPTASESTPRPRRSRRQGGGQ